LRRRGVEMGWGGGLQKAIHTFWGVGWWECAEGGVWDTREVGMMRESFEELSMGMRGDSFSIREHPYIVLDYF
jgi:hypothetical protein